MKNLAINFREPNIDRFLEIMTLARLKNLNFKICILNMPAGLESFIDELDGTILLENFCLFNEAEFAVEYSANFNRCFEIPEPVTGIKERIKNATEIKNPVIGEVSVSLLKTAFERLALTKDEVQSIIHLSYVIACLDQAGKIETQHIAEAIHYSKKTIDEPNLHKS